jgi:hypothetical protein
MSDISDLHGVYAIPLRWNPEEGTLGRAVYDPDTGDRTLDLIELGSAAAKFAADYGCRERGYGKIKSGLYDMRLTAVGSPPPAWPEDDDFKAAVGWWVWNPVYLELRFETNAAMLVRAVSALWDRIRNFKESAEGLQPVIYFIDKRERFIQAVGKTFFEPVIDIIGWVEREKIPAFRVREVTVKPPMALDSQVPFAALQKPSSVAAKAPGAIKTTTSDFIDDVRRPVNGWRGIYRGGIGCASLREKLVLRLSA